MNKLFDIPDLENEKIVNACSKNNCKDIYNLALSYQEQQRHEIGIGLFEKTMRVAKLTGDVFYLNKALNEIEITRHRIYLKSMPQGIHITLTRRCNMKCTFCYLRRYSSGSDISKRSCEEISRLFPYLKRLVWQGGEAFLHPQFRKMIAKSTRFPNIQQTLLTNGSFLNEEWIELFLKIPEFHLVIPIESVKKETYEGLRKGGSFKKLKRNINLVNSLRKNSNNKIYLSMNTILMKKNYMELKRIVDFAVENKFYHIIFTPLYPNGTEFYKKERISPDDNKICGYLSVLMPKLLAKAAKNNVYLDDRFTSSIKKEKRKRYQKDWPGPIGIAGCLAPWQQVFIESTGEVKNYCHCGYTIGNLNANSILEIWNGDDVIKLRANILNKDDYHLCNQICKSGVLNKSDLILT